MIASLVLLFALGGTIAVVAPLLLPSAGAPVVASPEAALAPLSVVHVPLDMGLNIGARQPEGLQWAPDANKLAWYVFDPVLDRMVVSSVDVAGQGFHTIQTDVGAKPWPPSTTANGLAVSVAGTLVKVQDRTGRTVAAVDIQREFGHSLATAPAIATEGDRTLVAVASKAPEGGWSVHVFDVSHQVANF